MNFTNRLHSCRAAALEPLLDFRRPVIPIRGLPDVHATCDGTLFYCDKIFSRAPVSCVAGLPRIVCSKACSRETSEAGRLPSNRPGRDLFPSATVPARRSRFRSKPLERAQVLDCEPSCFTPGAPSGLYGLAVAKFIGKQI
jgi:hypothetical protein